MGGRNRKGNTANAEKDDARRPPFNDTDTSRVADYGRKMNGDSGLAETRFVRRNPVFEDDDTEELGHNVTPNRPTRHMKQQGRKFSQIQPARWIVGDQTPDDPYAQIEDDENVDDNGDCVNVPNGRNVNAAEFRRNGDVNQHGMEHSEFQDHSGVKGDANGQVIPQMQQHFQEIQGQDIQGFQKGQENQEQPSHQQLQTNQSQQYLLWQQHQQHQQQWQQQQQQWQQQQHLWLQGQQQNMPPWQQQQQQQHLYNDGNGHIYTVQPPTQNMTRGDPDKSAEPGVPKLKDPVSRCLQVFKRLMSIALVICDTVLDWMEYSDFLPEDVSDVIDTASELKGVFGKHTKVGVTYNCDASENYYLVFTIFGTIFAVIQVADIIGETIPDITAKYKGFRLLHGFNEVLITYALEEIPQAICLVFFSSKCGCEFDLSISGKGLRKVYTTILGFLSGYTRQTTCRQVVERPCCYSEIDCTCCFIPLCEDPSRDLKACTCNRYKLPPCDICPSSTNLSCLGIFGVDDRDRKFARWLTAKLSKLYSIVSLLVIIFVVLRKCL